MCFQTRPLGDEGALAGALYEVEAIALPGRALTNLIPDATQVEAADAEHGSRRSRSACRCAQHLRGAVDRRQPRLHRIRLRSAHLARGHCSVGMAAIMCSSPCHSIAMMWNCLPLPQIVPGIPP